MVFSVSIANVKELSIDFKGGMEHFGDEDEEREIVDGSMEREHDDDKVNVIIRNLVDVSEESIFGIGKIPGMVFDMVITIKYPTVKKNKTWVLKKVTKW